MPLSNPAKSLIGYPTSLVTQREPPVKLLIVFRRRRIQRCFDAYTTPMMLGRTLHGR